MRILGVPLLLCRELRSEVPFHQIMQIILGLPPLNLSEICDSINGLRITWTLFYNLLLLHPWGMGFHRHIAQHIFHVRSRHLEDKAVKPFQAKDQEYSR